MTTGKQCREAPDDESADQPALEVLPEHLKGHLQSSPRLCAGRLAARSRRPAAPKERGMRQWRRAAIYGVLRGTKARPRIMGGGFEAVNSRSGARIRRSFRPCGCYPFMYPSTLAA